MSTTHESSTLPTPPNWLTDVKTWIAVGAVVFSLGSYVTVWLQDRSNHDALVASSNLILLEHQKITEALVSHAKNTGDKTQALLQEIVKVSRTNCVNGAKSPGERQACL